MKDLLEIIIPIRNEEANLENLVRRIDTTMKQARIIYRMVFIDDHSIDKTISRLKILRQKYPLDFFIKRGKLGKAYSILEGASHSKADYLVMIDGDLQYPPEAIPEMFFKLKKEKLGAVVTKRKENEENFVRKLLSFCFNTLFIRFLHGLNYDVQSGLKLFRKEIIHHLNPKKITPWTFDLSLLLCTKNLGFSIGEVEIKFAKREKGNSKINLWKTSLEIGKNALQLKFQMPRIFHLPPSNPKTMVGAGVFYNGKKLVSHTTRHFSESAVQTFVPWQKIFLIFLILILGASAFLKPLTTAIVLVAILTIIYFSDVVFSLYLVLRSLRVPPEMHFDSKELKAVKNENLPMYSILCPLYKESEVLSQFVDSIKRLDWPKNKLDVLLLLEENDYETIQVAYKKNLPEYFRILIVPDSEPKTKPKACNYGLAYAKGDYLVVYDAEDRPEPNQLKKAYLGFQQVSPEIVCLQAKLNYYNPHQNLLTKLFTAEYSLWFDVVLIGLQAIETIIPLGGTSNHFRIEILRKLKGWDPFNVTEDCDLGVRLFNAGYKTGIIDSTSYEEANSNLGNWLRQRSRWIKGYFQTYLVHMRCPRLVLKKQKIHAFLFQLVIGIRISFMLINPLLWLVTLSYFLLNSWVGSTIESVYIAPIFYPAVFSMIIGNFIYIYNYMIGCVRRKHWRLIKYVFLVPFYSFLASTAALIALYQLIIKPHYWEKTVHGFHLQSEDVVVLPKLTSNSFVQAITRLFSSNLGGKVEK